MTRQRAITTEEVASCRLCGSSGTLLYSQLSDRLFGAPGKWGHRECHCCGLVWLSPRPVPAAIAAVYRRYYTHGRARRWASLREKAKRALYGTVPGYESIAGTLIWKHLGIVLSWIPYWKERAVLGAMCLNGTRKGKLLDVGCGDGGFLALMRDAGWEVMGIEPDPRAASFAREKHGIPVIAGTLAEAALSDKSVDVVTLSHVIEHAYDPILVLEGCRRILKPKGKVIIVTPNLAGQGHQMFKSSWVHLDPPRHLYLFSPATLRSSCERAGLKVEMLRTSVRGATWVWAASTTIRRKGSFRREVDFTWRLGWEGLKLQRREQASCSTPEGKDAGEEIVLIASVGPEAVRKSIPSTGLEPSLAGVVETAKTAGTAE